MTVTKRAARGRKRDPARREERTKVIVTEAARLMHELGYTGTSMKRLAKVLGVSDPALYYYFRSKQELLYMVVSRSVDTAIEQSDQILIANISPSIKLQRMIVMMTIEVLNSLPMFAIYFRDKDYLLPRHQAAMRAKERKLLHIFTSVYRDCMEKGKIDGQLTAVDVLTVFGAICWSYKWWKPGKISSADVGERIAQVLLFGLLSELSPKYL